MESLNSDRIAASFFNSSDPVWSTSADFGYNRGLIERKSRSSFFGRTSVLTIGS